MSEQGWATQEELETIVSEFRRWAERPDAFYAWMYCAAVGWVAAETDCLDILERHPQS